jgi:hypothetical protein
LGQIDLFWKWFESNHEKYSTFNELYTKNPEEANKLLELITKALKAYSEGLFVEISANEVSKELIITSQGNREFFADIFQLVNNAPMIDNWNFIATRPAIGIDFNFQMGEVTIHHNQISFMPLEAEEYPNDVAIRLFHEDYTKEEGATRNAVIVGLYSALNMLLGEMATTLDFQYIDFDDMPHPKEQSFPFSQLAEYVSYKKAQRANSGVEFPKEDIDLREGRIEELPTLLVLNKSLKFYEFTQNYPYLLQMSLTLKNIGDNGLPKGNTDELYLIEDTIYQDLPKREKGHFVATETYNGKRELFYYAQSKKLIDEILELLPKEYSTCEVHYSVEYDPFWVKVDKYREL